MPSADSASARPSTLTVSWMPVSGRATNAVPSRALDTFDP
ncbi:Uncharacterised protein [Mycobacteroides abscessus]|nr:Uncharacterised protein [Mycobacteroides abscessus]